MVLSFFFFKQKTAYEMRISDWSSDVCSSDLLRQQLLSGDISRGSGAAQVKLKLEDGSTYPEKGVLKFTDVTVDPTTGSQIIRAQSPNPRGLLLPGMYVRADLVDGTKSNGLLVPQDRKSTCLNYSHQCASRMPSYH